MNRKFLPLILMLSAGLVTVIITFIRGYSVLYKLGSLLAVFVIFYLIGSVIVFFLDHFDKVNSAAAENTETVYEKGADGELSDALDSDKENS